MLILEKNLSANRLTLQENFTEYLLLNVLRSPVKKNNYVAAGDEENSVELWVVQRHYYYFGKVLEKVVRVWRRSFCTKWM